MTLNRVLAIAAVVCFVLVVFSAFGDEINVNETGFLALGLACWAASQVISVPSRSLSRR